MGISFNFQDAISQKTSFRRPRLEKNSFLCFILHLPSVDLTANILKITGALNEFRPKKKLLIKQE